MRRIRCLTEDGIYDMVCRFYSRGEVVDECDFQVLQLLRQSLCEYLVRW
jgi:hypothetical protein